VAVYVAWRLVRNGQPAETVALQRRALHRRVCE
jgi:hypothetical protein